MAEQKTKPTDMNVDAFLASVEPGQRREDARTICAMMGHLSGEPPRMWGTSMVGFGRYQYRYASGHSGEAFLTGSSPRKNALVLYIMDGFESHADLLARLGKVTTGKSCFYIKKLSDVDRDALEKMIAGSLDFMRRTYHSEVRH